MMYDACVDCGEVKTGVQRKSLRCGSCAKKGKTRSQETKEKIRARMLGTTNGAGNKGKTHSIPHSLEARQAISLGLGGDGDILNRKYPGLGRWTRLVKERDGHKCAECGYQGTKGDNFMDAHHMVPKVAYPELATVLFNGVTLCRPCHKQIHREPQLEGLQEAPSVSAMDSYC